MATFAFEPGERVEVRLSDALRAVPTHELEAELHWRRDREAVLRDLAEAKEALGDDTLIIHLGSASGMATRWSVGPTRPHARDLLRDAMVQAIEARIAELEGGPS